MKRRIIITLVEKKGNGYCHHGHRIGDRFDYETDRGRLCPMAMRVAFPYMDMLRYGGSPPRAQNGKIRFCCPDSDVIQVETIRQAAIIPC